MSFLEAVLYGAVQGIAEYLPISSSAHLALLPRFLGTHDPGLTFDVLLHIGTLLSTLLYFRKDWLDLLRGRSSVRISWILLATLPALALGGLFHHAIETVLRGNYVIAASLALGGIALFVVDRLAPVRTSLEQLGPKRALGVGLAQCLSLIPGFSRSGSTLIGGRLLGLDRREAARFSFLLSAPVTAAAILYECRNWRELTESTVGLPQLLAALVSSFVFGWIAIGGLLKLLQKQGFGIFAIYRVLLAITIVWVLGSG
jgi:undecaprenyl-diphosphatase